MSMYNTLLLTITCPRCGTEAEMEADFRFGLRDLSRYRMGDRLRWEGMGVKTPEKRPEGGNYDDEAYVVCPHCERDFWLKISVRNDVIVSATVDHTKQPYITDESLQQEEQIKPVKFTDSIQGIRPMGPFDEDHLLKALPRSQSEILAAIEIAQQEGPSTIAQIAMLCLWWVGQHDHPRRSYTGPDGLLPLDHLMSQFELQRQDDRPAFVSGSTLANITSLFPKPATPRPPTVRVSDEEAREQIEHAIQEAQQAIYPIRQNFLLCESLVDFAKRGFTSDQLQPHLQLLIKQWSSDTDPFGNGPRALLQVGEHRLAFQMLDSIPFTSFMGATVWSDCAKILVELEQPTEARRLLDRLWAERQNIPTERFASDQVRVAETYAYLGDAKTARQIVTKASVESRLLIECLVAWEQYLHDKSSNLNEILPLLGETRRLEPPKHRAHIQTAVLKLLLHLGKYEEAWDLLPLIRNSLLAIPLWSKLEFRAYEVAAALLPYCGKFASVIHPFAVDLLVSKAKDQELWPMVHMVSGLAKLIIRWSDDDRLSTLLTFLKSWQDARAGGSLDATVPQPPIQKNIIEKDLRRHISRYNLEEVEEFWAKAAEIAERILSGKTGIIEGTRILVSMTSLLEGIEHDPVFIAFTAIDSETDHLPIGKEREFWADSALQQKDVEIKQMEDHYREQAFAACRALIEKWKDIQQKRA